MQSVWIKKAEGIKQLDHEEGRVECFRGSCVEEVSFSSFFVLCWVFLAARGLSLVVASRDYSLVGVLRLLITVASLVAKHRFYVAQASAVVVSGS